MQIKKINSKKVVRWLLVVLLFLLAFVHAFMAFEFFVEAKSIFAEESSTIVFLYGGIGALAAIVSIGFLFFGINVMTNIPITTEQPAEEVTNAEQKQ